MPDPQTKVATPRGFLELLAARDFDGLTAALAPDARGRLLLPRGLEEPAGRDAIVGHIKSWFGSASSFELVTSSEDVVGTRQRITWRFDVVRDGRREVIEQLAYLDYGPEGIRKLDLLCSGFHQASAAPAEATSRFDAGTMGCSDGLAEEFREQMTQVPLGGRLEVIVTDPAAKEDLPSLARMLGQRITSTEATQDGRLIITVERTK